MFILIELGVSLASTQKKWLAVCFTNMTSHFKTPLVNVYITMEHHHFQWVNPLFLWPFSIAFCMFTRGYGINPYSETVKQ